MSDLAIQAAAEWADWPRQATSGELLGAAHVRALLAEVERLRTENEGLREACKIVHHKNVEQRALLVETGEALRELCQVVVNFKGYKSITRAKGVLAKLPVSEPTEIPRD